MTVASARGPSQDDQCDGVGASWPKRLGSTNSNLRRSKIVLRPTPRSVRGQAPGRRLARGMIDPTLLSGSLSHPPPTAAERASGADHGAFPPRWIAGRRSESRHDAIVCHDRGANPPRGAVAVSVGRSSGAGLHHSHDRLIRR